MGTVMFNSLLSSHPVTYALPPRGLYAWMSSICWLSKQGRLDRFPKAAARRFDATPKVTKALLAEGLWVDAGDSFIVPQVIASHGCGAIRLWKFGPLEVTRPKIPESLRQAVYERDGYACLHCGATEGLSLDHIHPFSRGGKDTIDNLQTLCRSCNSKKGARV